METSYFIPANSKKGLLFLNLFRPIDMLIFGIGIGLTLIMLIFLDLDNLVSTIIILSPALIAAALVTPIPNYHNTLTIIISFIEYFTQRQRFVWKGWCLNEKIIHEKK